MNELDKEQLNLLSDLVEASWKRPPDQRREFLVFRIEQAGVGHVHISDPALDPQYKARQPDLDLLERAGLIGVWRPSDVGFLSVTPRGFRRYEEAKRAAGEATERIEAEVRKYLDSNRFRLEYPAAYEKWALAEGLLWRADSGEQVSAIGHHCREALREFVSVLVQRYQPVDAETDPQRTINRLQAVLRSTEAISGTTERGFLKALVDYWKALNELVQRQEHSGQKERRPVVLEDGRRVVFQTMCVLYEVDRVLNPMADRSP